MKGYDASYINIYNGKGKKLYYWNVIGNELLVGKYFDT